MVQASSTTPGGPVAAADGSWRVAAAPVTPEAWAPFGWIPVPDTDPADGTQRLEYAWADPHANIIHHAPSEVPHDPEGLVCERMYRHDTHTQVLLALNGPSVLAVAPADTDPATAEGLRAVRAFRLETLDAVVLHRGTWHWGPFPLGDEPVLLFNVQGLGYARDNAAVEIAAAGITLLVTSPG